LVPTQHTLKIQNVWLCKASIHKYNGCAVCEEWIFATHTTIIGCYLQSAGLTPFSTPFALATPNK